ncbi:site-specific DNA-methyltransferase, partial [Sulfurospirillum sp.]|nr:site-specific DNA-methyltransferase [Sulfurospirillum sp.]
MPYIDWMGKDDVVDHHKNIAYKTITCKENIGDEDSQNMIIKGDNLLALKSLLPYYASSVKMIYIDPPYNTGNTSWVYNDNMDSPLIKKWLNDTVNADDLSRSDKWLCMMYPRLKLLRELLKDDGVIFISIDDAEVAHLKMICNEIFGSKNFIEMFIWNTDGNIDNQKKIKNNHEYVLTYAKNIDTFKSPNIIDPNIDRSSKLFKEYIENTIIKNGVKNPPTDILLPRGFPCDFKEGFISKNIEGFPIKSNNIMVKNYKTTNAVTLNSGWSSNSLCLEFIRNKYSPVLDTKNQESIFKLKKTGALYVYKKRTENQSHVLSVLRNMGSTQQMNSFLEKLNISFDYPKPLSLIKYLLSLNDDKNAIILDSFAGTGTTANAVLELNKDGGNRKFILIEMLNYAKNITVERNKKIIEGYTYKDKKGKITTVKGLGGGFKYCELSEDIFDEFGELNPKLTFNQ